MMKNPPDSEGFDETENMLVIRTASDLWNKYPRHQFETVVVQRRGWTVRTNLVRRKLNYDDGPYFLELALKNGKVVRSYPTMVPNVEIAAQMLDKVPGWMSRRQEDLE